MFQIIGRGFHLICCYAADFNLIILSHVSGAPGLLSLPLTSRLVYVPPYHTPTPPKKKKRPTQKINPKKKKNFQYLRNFCMPQLQTEPQSSNPPISVNEDANKGMVTRAFLNIGADMLKRVICGSSKHKTENGGKSWIGLLGFE